MAYVKTKPGRRELIAEIRRVCCIPPKGRSSHKSLDIEDLRELVLWVRNVERLLAEAGRTEGDGASA